MGYPQPRPKEDLATEDSLITADREAIKNDYGVNVLSYKDIAK